SPSAPKAVVQAIQAGLKEVSGGITSFIQNHDPRSLEQIQIEGRETSHLIEGLREALVQNGKIDVFAHLDDAHRAVREATVGLLASDHDVVESRKAFDQSNEALKVARAQNHGGRREKGRENTAFDEYITRIRALQQIEHDRDMAMDRFVARRT